MIASHQITFLKKGKIKIMLEFEVVKVFNLGYKHKTFLNNSPTKLLQINLIQIATDILVITKTLINNFSTYTSSFRIISNK